MSVCLTLRFLWEFLLPITFWTAHVLYLTSITVSMLFFNFYLCSIYLFWNFRKRNTVTQSLEHEWMKVNDNAFKHFLKSHFNKFCIIISLMLKSAAARFEAFTFLVKISNSPVWVTYVFSCDGSARFDVRSNQHLVLIFFFNSHPIAWQCKLFCISYWLLLFNYGSKGRVQPERS